MTIRIAYLIYTFWIKTMNDTIPSKGISQFISPYLQSCHHHDCYCFAIYVH